MPPRKWQNAPSKESFSCEHSGERQDGKARLTRRIGARQQRGDRGPHGLTLHLHDVACVEKQDGADRRGSVADGRRGGARLQSRHAVLHEARSDRAGRSESEAYGGADDVESGARSLVDAGPDEIGGAAARRVHVVRNDRRRRSCDGRWSRREIPDRHRGSPRKIGGSGGPRGSARTQGRATRLGTAGVRSVGVLAARHAFLLQAKKIVSSTKT